MFVNTIDESTPRLPIATKLASKYNIAMITPGQESAVKSTLQEIGLWPEYEFTVHDHYFCPVEKGLQVTYTIPDTILLRPLTAEHVQEVDDHLPYKSANTAGYMRQMIEFLPSIGAFSRDTGELMAWILTYMNESHRL